MGSADPRRIGSGVGDASGRELLGTSTSDDTPPIRSHNAALRPGTKLYRIYHALLAGSLNRFEAERIGDHCLHSTVARLQSYGIVIARVNEKVPTNWGKPATVCRYWIPAS